MCSDHISYIYIYIYPFERKTYHQWWSIITSSFCLASDPFANVMCSIVSIRPGILAEDSTLTRMKYLLTFFPNFPLNMATVALQKWQDIPLIPQIHQSLPRESGHWNKCGMVKGPGAMEDRALMYRSEMLNSSPCILTSFCWHQFDVAKN